MEATADPKNRYVAVFALLLNKKYNVLLVTKTINPWKKYYPKTATSLLNVSFLYLWKIASYLGSCHPLRILLINKNPLNLNVHIESANNFNYELLIDWYHICIIRQPSIICIYSTSNKVTDSICNINNTFIVTRYFVDSKK